MLYLNNAFSFSQIAHLVAASVEMLVISAEEARDLWNQTPSNERFAAVGHKESADRFSRLLGQEIAFNRVSIDYKRGDFVIVLQYAGPRAPEGAGQDWWAAQPDENYRFMRLMIL